MLFRDTTASSVLVVDGFGVSLTVTRGHLLIRDGLGRHHRERRLPRAQRTVRRIVILGHSGHVTLDAIRWCHDTGIAIVQLDTDGTILLTAGKPGADDPRLRRAQAAAAGGSVGVEITRRLLGAKLDGQASVAAELLAAPGVADTIRGLAEQLADCDDLVRCRDLEAQASNAYFAAWTTSVTCRFAERDAGKVPDHWAVFGSRGSPLHRGGRSPRNAADPINALLNYGYALAEAEAHLAALAVGLDPGLGIVHTDKKNRDSLALDLLEPLRPHVERHVLQLLAARHFRASDLHETRQGACRLVPPLTHELAEQLPDYARAVAPLAETVTHLLADSSPGKIELRTPLSRAKTTGAQLRGKRSADRRPPSTPTTTPTCRTCGVELTDTRRRLCPACWPITRTALASERAKAGNAALARMRDEVRTPRTTRRRRRSGPHPCRGASGSSSAGGPTTGTTGRASATKQRYCPTSSDFPYRRSRQRPACRCPPAPEYAPASSCLTNATGRSCTPSCRTPSMPVLDQAGTDGPGVIGQLGGARSYRWPTTAVHRGPRVGRLPHAKEPHHGTDG